MDEPILPLLWRARRLFDYSERRDEEGGLCRNLLDRAEEEQLQDGFSKPGRELRVLDVVSGVPNPPGGRAVLPRQP